MKLIIDMPEEYYKQIKDFALLYPTSLYDTIRNGTPLQAELEEIKAEIQERSWYHKHFESRLVEICETDKIIDKHISELKGENKP